MDRKAFLKTVCGLGVCGCVASLVDPPEALAATPEQAPDQRLAFARYQVAKMVGFMAAGTAAPACAEILEKTGRECAKLGQLARQVQGRPRRVLRRGQEGLGHRLPVGQGEGHRHRRRG